MILSQVICDTALASEASFSSKDLLISLQCYLDKNCDPFEKLTKENRDKGVVFSSNCDTSNLPPLPGLKALTQEKFQFCEPRNQEYFPKLDEIPEESKAQAYLKHPSYCTRLAAKIMLANKFKRNRRQALSFVDKNDDYSKCKHLGTELADIRFKVLWRNAEDPRKLLPYTDFISAELRERFLAEEVPENISDTFLNSDNALKAFGRRPEKALPYLCSINHPVCPTSTVLPKISYYTILQLSRANATYTIPDGEAPTPLDISNLKDYPIFFSKLDSLNGVALPWPLPGFVTSKYDLTFENVSYLFPKPYALPKVCTEMMPEEMIYSLMRQESVFDPRAKSPAGAIGLLQVLPLNARGINLYNPEENLKAGCRLINRLYRQYENPFLMVLAYNAGGRFVKRLLEENEKLPTDIEGFITFVERIPWEEPRNYLKIFVRNSYSYLFTRSKTVKFCDKCLTLRQGSPSEFLPDLNK